MSLYTLTRDYAAIRDGKRFGPWKAGEVVDLTDDDAAWVERDSLGALNKKSGTDHDDSGTDPAAATAHQMIPGEANQFPKPNGPAGLIGPDDPRVDSDVDGAAHQDRDALDVPRAGVDVPLDGTVVPDHQDNDGPDTIDGQPGNTSAETEDTTAESGTSTATTAKTARTSKTSTVDPTPAKDSGTDTEPLDTTTTTKARAARTSANREHKGGTNR